MPAPEDYPVMPVEAASVLLRPRNFFVRNPCLDVPPVKAVKPSDVASGRSGRSETDKSSVEV